MGHLQRYPMLALEHKIGRLIREQVGRLSTVIEVKETRKQIVDHINLSIRLFVMLLKLGQ
ncbi:hypothetical protein B9D94_14445 [Paenibacillus sp. Cedars]|nr:hypothetical protein B9D94_14445 [Paenibacillus sp. Cedars]